MAYEAVFGTVRPLFVLVAGWAMATSQVLRRHITSPTGFGGYLLFPAYQVFYQAFTVAALYLVYNRHNERAIEQGDMPCQDFKEDTISKFGFLKNPTLAYRFTLKLGILFVFSLASAAGAAYLSRHAWPPPTVTDARRQFVYFACANLCLMVFTYTVLTARLADVVSAEEWDMIVCPIGERLVNPQAAAESDARQA